jgi:hypothetical protein
MQYRLMTEEEKGLSAEPAGCLVHPRSTSFGPCWSRAVAPFQRYRKTGVSRRGRQRQGGLLGAAHRDGRAAGDGLRAVVQQFSALNEDRMMSPALIAANVDQVAARASRIQFIRTYCVRQMQPIY